MNGMQVSRRRFLQAMVAAAAAPQFVPSRVFAAETAPSKTIQLGHIGVGGQGTGLLNNFLGVTGAKSVAVCDPYKQRREKAAATIKQRQGHDPKLYNDFRELLADPSIDAVVIASPDHWHVPLGLAAVRAGKDVYIEKPLGKSLLQNKAMLEACAKHGRIFQYGTQQRSQELIHRGVELVRNGHIGDLQRLEVWAPKGSDGGGSLDEVPVPEGLDYELYIGPAPMKPCTKDRITSAASWHCSDYAIGFIAGWGAHPLDVAIWGIDSDQAGPFTLAGTGRFPSKPGLFDTLSTWDVNLKFADGLAMRFMSNDVAQPVVTAYRKDWMGDGTTFFGSKGWISLSRGGCSASDPELLKIREPGPKKLPYHNRYYASFVESVRNHTTSIAPVDHAVRSDAISHLSLIAIRAAKEITWDPKAYQFQGAADLNAAMAVQVRGDWKQS